MQHAWKHVERPGGSHTALDGKNKLTFFSVTKFHRPWALKTNIFFLSRCLSAGRPWHLRTKSSPSCIKCKLDANLFSKEARCWLPWSLIDRLPKHRRSSRAIQSLSSIRSHWPACLECLKQNPTLFFPSNAVWLPPGRSTCFQACCMWD